MAMARKQRSWLFWEFMFVGGGTVGVFYLVVRTRLDCSLV